MHEGPGEPPGPTSNVDPFPTWDDIRYELRGLADERSRYVGIEVRRRSLGLGDPTHALKEHFAPMCVGGWCGFGDIEEREGVRASWYVVALVRSGLAIFNASPWREMVGILMSAGRHLRREGDAPEPGADAVRWFRRLVADGAGAPLFETSMMTNDDKAPPTTVEIQEIPDLIRASLAAIDRQEAARPPSMFEEALSGTSESHAAELEVHLARVRAAMSLSPTSARPVSGGLIDRLKALERRRSDPKPISSCSDDGTELVVAGKTYRFRFGQQAAAVRALWDANGQTLHNGQIAERIEHVVDVDSEGFSLAEVMRPHRKGARIHVAMRKGGPIVTVGKGRYRLRR